MLSGYLLGTTWGASEDGASGSIQVAQPPLGEATRARPVPASDGPRVQELEAQLRAARAEALAARLSSLGAPSVGFAELPEGLRPSEVGARVGEMKRWLADGSWDPTARVHAVSCDEAPCIVALDHDIPLTRYAPEGGRYQADPAAAEISRRLFTLDWGTSSMHVPHPSGTEGRIRSYFFQLPGNRELDPGLYDALEAAARRRIADFQVEGAGD